MPPTLLTGKRTPGVPDASAKISDGRAFVGYSSICQLPARRSGILILLEAFSEKI